MTLVEQFIPARTREFQSREAGTGERARLQQVASTLRDVIKLNSGDPDLTAAPVAVEGAVEALRAGKTRYAQQGVPELKRAIAGKLAAENGFTVDPDRQIIITNGSAEAASVIFQTLLEPGDEVLTTDPFYGGHVGAIVAARGVPVFVPTSGDDLWEPDLAEVERRITARTKAFIFANPGNPSAAVYCRETVQALLDLAHRRNILMIPDELFERYVYDRQRHVSMASLDGAGEMVITINGFSKSYCMTGWRLGWIAAPDWAARPLAQVRYALSMAASTPGQWGAIRALSDEARPYYDEVYRIYGERKDFFFGAFTRMGLPQRPPAGGVVGMVDIRRLRRPAYEVAEAILRDARMWVWSGTMFGSLGEGWLRVGLIRPLEELKGGMERVEPVIARFLTEAGG